jgi:hypothetical protein
VGEQHARPDVLGELAEVLVAPRRIDAPEQAGDRRVLVVPPDTEPVAVHRLGAQEALPALHDQGVLGLVQQLVQRHG